MPQVQIYLDSELDTFYKNKAKELGVSKIDVIQRVIKEYVFPRLREVSDAA